MPLLSLAYLVAVPYGIVSHQGPGPHRDRQCCWDAERRPQAALILLVLILPLIGMILYYVVGRSSADL
jgi:hypothetical protein